jgi:hypothetical protein
MTDHVYAHVPLGELARQIAYNATVIASTSPERLVAVHEDLLEAADLIIAAAEYLEEGGAARAPSVAPDGGAAFLALPPVRR